MAWRYVGAREADAPLIERLLAVWHHRRLLRRMAERDLRQRYAGAAVGYAWVAVYPLLLVTFYTAVFALVFRGRLAPGGSPQEYALYVVSGLLPWIAFSEVANRSTQAMAEQRSLVKFAVFPVQILPLTALYAAAITQMVGLAAVLAFAAYVNGGLSIRVFFLIPLLVLQNLFFAGVAWLLGALGAVLRDVRELVSIGLTVGMFLTPIFYVAADAPAPLRLVLALNPLTHLMNGYRAALLPAAPSSLESVVAFSLAAAVALVGGFWTFERTRVFLADIL